jgi:hypothetical protein
MNLSTSPARKRPRRVLARTALLGVAAASIAVIAGQAALAADPPAAPNNIVVFPQRDFVTIEGYQGRVGQLATVVVTRDGVETSRATGRIGAGDPAMEINHPGGECWQGVTPDIKPGDVVRISFSGGASDSTRTQRPEVTPQPDGAGFSKVGAFDLVVEGERGGVPLSRIEQRIVNPDMDATDIGRRDIRAPSRPGPYTSTLTAPTSTTFRATYHFVTDGDTTAAEATEMRDLAAEGQMRALSWQVTDGAGNRQGLTISEFGEVGGPGMGGCPLGPSAAPPIAPSGVTATAGNQSATASWSPATTVPDGSPITGYKVTAVNTANNVETSINAPLCTTACSATIPDLANGATYRIEVRALSEAGGFSAAGKATGTVSPAGVGAFQPVAPATVTATSGSPGGAVNATVTWNKPAQPAGVAVEGWRITAYDAGTLAPIKRVFLDEPTGPGTTRTRTVAFPSARSVVFRVQAIAADDAGTLSALSAASGAVNAR